MDNQLELFDNEPFVLRLKFSEASSIFQHNYWNNLPSAKTTKIHFIRMEKFFANSYLDSISKADVERLRRHLKDLGLSDPTVNKAHMILSRIFRKFEEYKEGRFVNGEDFSRIVLPKKNPAALVPKVNERDFARKEFITKEQKIILCSYSDEDLNEIIDALYWSELRPSDLFSITDRNVDLKNKTITGTQHKTITTSNPSGVPYKVHIPDSRIEMIQRRMRNTKPGTPLFRRKNLQKRWTKVRSLAGMQKIQLRDIRGSAATHLLDSGVDPETVRKTLGHTTLRMLPTYDKRQDAPVKQATEILVKGEK